ncbi:myocardial zonula adherens protein isoform X1 [Bombina bombina]|uniref:myocardial zonula adherens protein isoform X1 n=1 Tax=Bombina bombina TaxID=8345 RepID=UPI00235A8A01|nr:myocardial zonula adherens protein isoform X1 [Bombina bombina]
MMRYTTGTTGTTVTTAETSNSQKPGNICRLRLTLPADGTQGQGHKLEAKNEKPLQVISKVRTERRRIKNGYISSEKNVSDPPTLHLYSMPKSNPSSGGPSHGVVYGVVQRAEDNHQNEVVVYEWSTNQLKEEMSYIKDVRVTLENIRERMFGEYDEMKQKIKELTQEMKVSNVQQEVLENHSRSQSTALDSFGTMNSSLTAASIEIQKTLVDVTLENSNIKDEMKNLKHSYEESVDNLKEKQKLLEAAKNENQLLKLKIESSQEANAEVMREMTRKLYNQYEERLKQEELKYSAEKEALIGQTKQYLKAIEDASEKVRIAEIKIEERDTKIAELDKLVQRMEQEREQLQAQLMRHEEQIQRLDAKTKLHSTEWERSQHLEEAATSLRERIKHLDDMVHCQQKKVKHMIEEIELLRKKVHYKDLLIQQLLERISFLEGENTELQDKMEYLLANQSKNAKETKDVGISCDIPLRLTFETPTHPNTSMSGNSESDARERNNTELDAKSPVQRSYTPYMRVLELSMKNKVS